MESYLSVSESSCQPMLLFPLFDETPQPAQHRKIESEQKYPLTKKLGNRVLVIGRLRELALYRVEFLRQAGYIAAAPTDADEALSIMRRGHFDAIVLSYTLANEVVQRFADTAREYCPDCPIIAITETYMVDRRIAPDAIALADGGPSALLSALGRVLQAS